MIDFLSFSWERWIFLKFSQWIRGAQQILRLHWTNIKFQLFVYRSFVVFHSVVRRRRRWRCAACVSWSSVNDNNNKTERHVDDGDEDVIFFSFSRRTVAHTLTLCTEDGDDKWHKYSSTT